ncbi:MAG: SH3 domain-containing protein [Planctomycetota bacterium]
MACAGGAWLVWLGLCWVPIGSSLQERREALPEGAAPSRFVTATGAALYEAPGEPPGARLGTLRLATPVRVVEERAGWARVIIWGWVAAAELGTERPTETWEAPGPQGSAPGRTGGHGEAAPKETDAPARLPELVLEPELDDFGQPIVEVTKATRVTVVTYPEPASDSKPAGIGVSIGLVDPRGRLVAWEGMQLRFNLTLWEKKAVAGGHVRGRKLYEGSIQLENWKEGVYAASKACRIGFDQLDRGGVDSPWGILVVQTELPTGRMLFGRDYEVAVGPPAPERTQGE